MRHGDVELVNTRQEKTLRRRDLQTHPAIGIPPVAVPGQSDLIFPGLLGSVLDSAPHKQAGLQDRLKPVADSQNEFVSQQKLPHCVVQLSSQLTREDHAGSQIVTVTESTRDTQNLVLTEPRRVFQQSKQMQPLGRSPSQLEGMRGLDVAVGSGGSQDADSGDSHGCHL